MTAVKENSSKLLKSVKDDKFSIEKIERYCLIIELGERDLQVCIIDTSNNRVLVLEDYMLPNAKDDEERVQQLQELFESHHLLMVGFWKEVIVCFKSHQFALVPLSLFTKENARALLKMNCTISNHDSVGYYKVSANDSVNIFTYNKPVLSWLRSIYKNSKIRVTQQSGALINSVIENTKAKEAPIVSLYIDRFHLHAAVSHKDKLLFFNSFKINSFDEYLKYIALILHEFKLKNDTTDIQLWGHIKENSSHFTAIKKKFSGIQLANRTKSLNFGYKFDEIAEHQFCDLFGNYFNN